MNIVETANAMVGLKRIDARELLAKGTKKGIGDCIHTAHLCSLTGMEILRRAGFKHEVLTRPYKLGMASAWLVEALKGLFGQGRPSVPADPCFVWCGAGMTEHFAFVLPENGLLPRQCVEGTSPPNATAVQKTQVHFSSNKATHKITFERSYGISTRKINRVWVVGLLPKEQP